MMMWFFFAVLSTMGWALVNVFDSLLVHRYEKSPMLLMWSQSLFSIPFLLVLTFFFSVHSSLAVVLFAMGMTAYIGDLWFFSILDRLDVSLVNIGWAMNTLFLAIGGIYFFHESWTILHLIGATLVFVGVLFLSLWHREKSLLSTLWLVIILAILYTPFYLVKKWALLQGASSLTVFFWMTLSRETLAFSVPLFVCHIRHRALLLVQRMDVRFFVISGVVIACFFLGEFAGALAYQFGPISRVVLVNNVQPFLVIALSYLLYRFFPRYAPRESLVRSSVFVKIIAFSIVFIGLAFITIYR